MTELDISNGFYQAESLESMNSVCQNVYPKAVRLPNGEVTWKLIRTPGIVIFTFPGNMEFPNRGMFAIDDEPYAVNGNKFYRVESPLPVEIGDISGTGQVSLAYNGTQLMILVPGGTGYIYTVATDTLAEITDPDFTANGNPQYVIFIDGYFMCSTDSKTFIISALNDGTSWNALDFGSAEADPDPIVGLFNFKNEAYIFGSQTCEAFQNVGGSGFPFQRNGLILNKGLSSPFSIVESANTFMWIGSGDNEENAVYALQGAGTVKLSNPAIDQILRNLTADEVASILAFTYMQDGSFFACWTLPNVTIVYDTTENRWHTRVSNLFGPQTAWSAVNVIETSEGLLCGSLLNNENGSFIGRLDPDEEEEYGVPIFKEWDALQVTKVDKRVFSCPQVELSIDNNDTTGDVEMAISRDGYTLGPYRARTIAGNNNRRQRLKWRRNGRYTDYLRFRFRTTAAVEAVLGVDATFGVGRG